MTTRTYRRYISLEATKRDPVSIASGSAGQDTRLNDLIRKASHWIEEELERWFYPVIATYYFDHPPDDTILDIAPWLLSATTFTTNNTGTALVEGTDFHLTRHTPLKGRNLYTPPYNRIIMDPNGNTTNLVWTGTPLKANKMIGVWGWSDDTEDTGATVLNDPLAIGGTSLTVLTGTIETGWMLLIGDEQVFSSVVTEGATNDTVTIVRAQNGTTAAAHVATTAISRYVPPDDIEALCGIIVARLYHRGATKWSDTPAGGTIRWGDAVGSPDAGVLYYHALPAEARAIIDRYKETERGKSAIVTWDLLS